jgi:hypothetical protein
MCTHLFYTARLNVVGLTKKCLCIENASISRVHKLVLYVVNYCLYPDVEQRRPATEDIYDLKFKNAVKQVREADPQQTHFYFLLVTRGCALPRYHSFTRGRIETTPPNNDNRKYNGVANKRRSIIFIIMTAAENAILLLNDISKP